MIPAMSAKFPPHLVYPDSDGKPMADNTKQLRWMVVLFGNLCALFRDVLDVFIGADLLWYPVEGHPEIRQAPDVLAAFGRPRGDRGSYQQWQEGGVPVTVVFEIISPGNTHAEMIDKFAFYEEHGVEEYYEYNPETNRLFVYLRKGELLLRERFTTEFVSPRLRIRFAFSGPEMTVYYPDGRHFLTFEELEVARLLAEQRGDKAEQRADKAEQRADKAEQQIDKAEQRADKAEQRAIRIAVLSRKARLGQASPEELVELEGLERDLTSCPPLSPTRRSARLAGERGSSFDAGYDHVTPTVGSPDSTISSATGVSSAGTSSGTS